MEVHQRLNEGIGLKGYLHGSLDEGTHLKVEFRTGGVDPKEHRKRIRKVYGDDDMFWCDCGSAFEDRIHTVGEMPPTSKRGGD